MALSERDFEKYDITRQLADNKPQPTLRELGGTGNTSNFWINVFNEDYNPHLRGKRAIQIYDQMRRGDAQVAATMRVIKSPFLGAQWYVQPASDSPLDQKVARFVDWAMNNMSRTWLQFVHEAMLAFEFGWYAFEKVYEEAQWRDADTPSAKPMQVIKWKKFAPRHPKTLYRFQFDANGGIEGMWQTQSAGDPVFIPVDKLMLFTIQEEAGNPEGISFLRTAYKHWYYKENFYKIDGIQKERHGIGIPRVKLPIGYTAEDKRLAGQMGRNLRTNDQAHIVQLPGWEVDFVNMNVIPADALKSAEHHDTLIATNVLAQFLTVGTSDAGSRSTVAAAQSMFVRSIRYIADLYRGVLNQFAVPQLVDYNFTVERYPELKVRRLGDADDWRALSTTLRNLIQAKLITPNPDLEKWLLEQMEFPQPPKEAVGVTTQERVDSLNANATSTVQGTPGPDPTDPAAVPNKAPGESPATGV